MLHVTMIVCDNLIHASVGDDNLWHGTAADALTGQRMEFAWTNAQMGAVCALAVGGEDFEAGLNAALYAVAEPLFEGWPRNLRCIP